jgi:hypothetical protein
MYDRRDQDQSRETGGVKPAAEMQWNRGIWAVFGGLVVGFKLMWGAFGG